MWAKKLSQDAVYLRNTKSVYSFFVSTLFVGRLAISVFGYSLFLSPMPIYFHEADAANPLKQRNALKAFIEAEVFEQLGKQILLSVVFCSDEYLLKVNQDFLQHDYFTDIITFPLGNTKEQMEAEIYISVDRVKENAKLQGDTFQRELHRVVFHGVLHLLGQKDKTKAQQAAMRTSEDRWLMKYGLIN